MKFEAIIGNVDEEKVVVYANSRTSLVDSIEGLINSFGKELTGYNESEIYKFSCTDADLYAVEDNKVYAYVDTRKLVIRERLYTIEEMVGDVFVKINQSCIIRVDRIEKFESSFGGSVRVAMKNGYKDYISRRQLRVVKERFGFKI